MAGTPTACFRAIGAVALILGGIVVAGYGVLLTLLSIWQVIEFGNGHGSGYIGGLLIMIYGLGFTAAGAVAARKGRKIYRAIEIENDG